MIEHLCPMDDELLDRVEDDSATHLRTFFHSDGSKHASLLKQWPEGEKPKLPAARQPDKITVRVLKSQELRPAVTVEFDGSPVTGNAADSFADVGDGDDLIEFLASVLRAFGYDPDFRKMWLEDDVTILHSYLIGAGDGPDMSAVSEGTS